MDCTHDSPIYYVCIAVIVALLLAYVVTCLLTYLQQSSYSMFIRQMELPDSEFSRNRRSSRNKHAGGHRVPVTHGKKRFLPSFNSDPDVDVEQPEGDDY